MFSYFGSKSKVVDLYPRPLYDTIIEPFAGSARYALRYYTRNVWINDCYPVVYEIWKWIQNATRDDIRSLPVIRKGQSLDDYQQLSQVERNLLGFAVGMGRSSPGTVMTGFACRRWTNKREVENHNEIVGLKQRLLKYQGKLSHWKITAIDYAEIPNQQATWYIDPPYQEAGNQYVHHEIDYVALGKWCRSRKGQIMVCEALGADWLPFQPMTARRSSFGDRTAKVKYREVLYYQSDRREGLGIF